MSATYGQLETFKYAAGDAGTLGPRWEAWLEGFKLYLEANDINKCKGKVLFKLQMGEQARKIFHTLAKPEGKMKPDPTSTPTDIKQDIPDTDTLPECYALMSNYFRTKRSKWTEQCVLLVWCRSEERAQLPQHLSAYRHVAKEINATTSGILLRDQRIIVPAALRDRVADLAHAGHQGIEKTKALVRARVWFPGIDKLVQDRVKRCQACQANTDRRSYEPMVASPMPQGPWQVVGGDFFGPMADGSYWFVNHCEYSRWAMVHHIRSVSADTVIPVLDEMFSMFGTPLIYKTDNGSPFQSHAFAAFAKRLGFRHRQYVW